MHRSGTSAVTRVCNLLGVEVGGRHLGPQPDNETGFWEHKDITRLHEELLASIGSAYDDVRVLPEDWLADKGVATYRGKIIEILRRDLADVPLWGIKDPRLCRLVPLWLSILNELKCAPHFVFVTRNPLEVAGSLASRNGFPASKSLMLWLRHVIDSERDTRRFSRAFITYEALLRDWRRTMSRAARELGLVWPNKASAVSAEVGHFLRSHLRHQRIDDVILETDREISRWVREAYQVLKAAADGDASRLSQTLSAIAKELDAASRLYQPWLSDIEAELTGLRAEVAERDGQVAAIMNSTRKNQITPTKTATASSHSMKQAPLRLKPDAHWPDGGALVRYGRLLSPQNGVPASLKRSLPPNLQPCESVWLGNMLP